MTRTHVGGIGLHVVESDETPAQKVRRLSASARSQAMALAVQFVGDTAAHSLAAEDLASLTALPPGVRAIAEQVARQNRALAQSLDALLGKIGQ